MTKDSDSPKLVVKRVALHSVALIFLVNIVLSFCFCAAYLFFSGTLPYFKLGAVLGRLPRKAGKSFETVQSVALTAVWPLR